ncbi:AMP-binding protein [Cognatiyoonia sp. IB215182]|nr:AMP-binding protein [Cognatiyoonia sp. IB215182]
MTLPELDELTLSESGLGFDSLALLDLVLKVNTFFNLHKTGIEDYLLVYQTLGDWVGLIVRHFDLIEDQAEFSFQTSGSTGNPKLITHNIADLQAEVKGIVRNQVLPVRRSSRILNLVPPHHIYGFLFSCLLPSITKLDVVDLHGKPFTNAIRLAIQGDIVLATPFLWNRMARSGMIYEHEVHGVTAAEPSSQETWSVVENTKLSSFTEILGATETGGVGFRKSFDDDFDLLPHLTRDGAHVRRKVSEESYLDLQDRLEWTGDKSFRFGGRIDNAVQVAGVNVSLAHVSDTISAVAGVKQVNVRFVEERIIALVVPHNTSTISQDFYEALHLHVVKNLEPVARPSELIILPELKTNSMGKYTIYCNEPDNV